MDANQSELPIASIVIGHRHRRDFGDIDQLADSIRDTGLLHPIVVTPDSALIAGQRRLVACQQLGWTHVPVRVIDLDNVVRGEYAENYFRKNFTPTEMADITDALMLTEGTQAKERMVAAHASPGKFPELVKGRALDHVARVVGKDRKTIIKAREVRDAAKVDPKRFGKLAEDMDRTGRVDGPFKRLQVMRQAEAIRAEPPPYPSRGPYRVIVADPPWPYEIDKVDPSHRATHPYPQMSILQICSMGTAIGAITHDDAILWLWTTNHHMREAFAVLDAWGFEHKTILTWVKDKFGFGGWLRGQTEHCLMAVRGSPVVEQSGHSTVLQAPLRAHSQKPDEFYVFVEELCPAPRYAELFSRSHRPRWDTHGDEVANGIGGGAQQ